MKTLLFFTLFTMVSCDFFNSDKPIPSPPPVPEKPGKAPSKEEVAIHCIESELKLIEKRPQHLKELLERLERSYENCDNVDFKILESYAKKVEQQWASFDQIFEEKL